MSNTRLIPSCPAPEASAESFPVFTSPLVGNLATGRIPAIHTAALMKAGHIADSRSWAAESVQGVYPWEAISAAHELAKRAYSAELEHALLDLLAGGFLHAVCHVADKSGYGCPVLNWYNTDRFCMYDTLSALRYLAADEIRGTL